jgi:uncharacterized protein (DUF362 family)
MASNPITRQMSRRQLLHGLAALGAVTGISALAAACTPINLPTESQPQAEENHVPAAALTPVSPASQPAVAGMVRVAFVKTRDRLQGVRQAIQLLGMPPVAQKKLLVKPNFNSADPAPGSTHPDVLRSVVEALWEAQAGAITVADRSGMGNTRRVMEDLGVFALARELDFAPLLFDELDKNAWAVIQPHESHWQQGFPMPTCCLEADALVQACCLKTHRFGGHFTLSLKNSVGMVAKSRPDESYNYMNELHGSAHQRRMIAEINAAYRPALIVMDGVDALVTGGPDRGKQVEANVILAATDRIAIDAVGVALLRHFGTTPEVSQGAIFEQEQIARAVELGLGITSAAQIELVTADPESAAYAAQIQPLLR